MTDDLSSDRRQEQIGELVERLASWLPTKVAVEAAPESPLVEALYRSFVEGSRGLGSTEIEQVGFRVARTLGHSRLYGVDAAQITEMVVVEQEADPEVMGSLVRWGQEVAAREREALLSSSVVEYVRRINAPAFLNLGRAKYLDELLLVGYGASFSGVELAAADYRRNLRIFANLRAVAEEDDRVLVLIGSSHAATLREFLGVWGQWEDVDPLDVI